MRKYLLLFLFSSSLAWANSPYDTSTSGSLKLLKPSLTTVDPNRHAADKYNTNFDIIDSSVSTALNRTPVISIYDEGTNQGNATTINAVGANVSMTVSGSTATLTVSGSGGGTVQNSTITITMFHSGGQVFIASSPFVAIDGLAFTPVITSTFHAFNFRAYTMSPSTVEVTKFQMVVTTSNRGAFPFNNWGPQIHSSTGCAFGTKISTNLDFNPASGYALHIDSIPASGLPPSTYGIQADGWFDPQ